MTMEDAQKREELINKAHRTHDDYVAAAHEIQLETINIAWELYENVRGRAQTNYVNEVKTLDIELVKNIEAIKVEVAEETGPVADQLPESGVMSIEQSADPEVPLQERSDTAAGPKIMPYEGAPYTDDFGVRGPWDPAAQAQAPAIIEGKLSPESKYLIRTREINDEYADVIRSIAVVEALNEGHSRSAGERRMIIDGLLAASDMAEAWYLQRQNEARAQFDIPIEGGNTDEIGQNI